MPYLSLFAGVGFAAKNDDRTFTIIKYLLNDLVVREVCSFLNPSLENK